MLLDEPMRQHTTFRIGGPARFFCRPGSAPQLKDTIAACEEAGLPWYILGNGSNVLVSDAGWDGVVIQLFHNLEAVRVEGCLMELEAGVLLVKAAHLAAKAGLTGLEFASGIPGTVGGALVMNAGAYGGEMKDVVREAVVMRKDGRILRLSREELELGYRTSVIAREGYVVLSALLELKEGSAAAVASLREMGLDAYMLTGDNAACARSIAERDATEIEARMQELKEARTSKQPLEYPSAGSTFKRPEGHFAGKLIMDAGLRGYRVGGAQVSESTAAL